MAEKVERIVRQRICESVYWKTACYSINAAQICDRAADLTAIGGLINTKPTDFLCLVYKLVLISPNVDIILEMLRQPYFKYLTALAVFYIRLCYNPMLVYQLLEPLYADYRKLRLIKKSGEQQILCMDEYIDRILRMERFLDLALPVMPARRKLEQIGLQRRVSFLPADLMQESGVNTPQSPESMWDSVVSPRTSPESSIKPGMEDPEEYSRDAL
ncbi:hypothetical protein DASB73_019330 [Starmerella bacillaris]|uniref:Pre-mRNA-splicing factor 38 n=1 Tax=Starmerella bacillaris TaxID=1247836 RepID=A0AAV5RHP6_STABA|nr:hypothetical protein DASB73_019330 [Starmerella bacillaris]